MTAKYIAILTSCALVSCLWVHPASASPSEVEQRALDAYSAGWRDVSLQVPPPQVLGKTVASPVWSFTF